MPAFSRRILYIASALGTVLVLIASCRILSGDTKSPRSAAPTASAAPGKAAEPSSTGFALLRLQPTGLSVVPAAGTDSLPEQAAAGKRPGLRIAPVWFPAKQVQAENNRLRGQRRLQWPADAYRITATASNGESFPLKWQLEGHDKRRWLFVPLPAAYPTAYQWLDIAITDKPGHSMQWRLAALPRLQRAIAEPVQPSPAARVSGIEFKASAELCRDEMHHNTPSALARWSVYYNDPSQQWSFTTGSACAELNARNDATEPASWPSQVGYMARVDFPAHNKFLHIDGTAVRRASHREKVVFYNLKVEYFRDRTSPGIRDMPYLALPHALTATTPSGVTVTLPAQGSPLDSLDYKGLHFKVHLPPGPITLPRSPLFQKYGRPVAVGVHSAGPLPLYSCGRGIAPSGVTSITLQPEKQKRTRLERLELTVEQECQVQSVPLSFVVPIVRPTSLARTP